MGNLSKVSGRILYIDFLKFIGLSCIILAHVNPPQWLFMLRNFDVPLMVLISAMLGRKTFEKYTHNNISATKFCISRVKRLAIPTWIFLVSLFLASRLLGHEYDVKYYLYSLLFTRYGIGYVWVILIYIYSAFLIPVCSKMCKLSRPWIYIIAIYLAYELLCFWEIGKEIKLIDSTIFYIIPYGLLTYLGFSYQSYSKKQKQYILIISALIFLICGVFYWIKYGTIQDVQIAKYSPRAYYLSYGILVSFSALFVCEKLPTKLYTNKFVVFISEHTMWIYLWHILVKMLYDKLHFPELWYVEFIFVYVVSAVIVVGVNMVLDVICKRIHWNFLQYLRG